MNFKASIPALAAVFALAGVTGAAAGDRKHDKDKRDRAERSAAAAGVGVAGANANGAVAGGLSASQATSMNRGRDRQGRSPDLNAAQTNSSGAIYTTRRSAAAAVNTNGSAAGTGSQYTGSTVDAYGETTRQGSSADIYGDSVAESTND